MHHASVDNGGGWCVYDDWTLALRKLRRETGNVVQKAMLIDLDVHQVSPQQLTFRHNILPILQRREWNMFCKVLMLLNTM